MPQGTEINHFWNRYTKLTWKFDMKKEKLKKVELEPMTSEEEQTPWLYN